MKKFLQTIDPISFHHIEADNYEYALKGIGMSRYDFYDSVTFVSLFSVFSFIVSAIIFKTFALPALITLGGGLTFFGLIDSLRRKSVKRILDDPSSKRLYELRATVDEYNREVKAFNTYLMTYLFLNPKEAKEAEDMHTRLCLMKQDLQSMILEVTGKTKVPDIRGLSEKIRRLKALQATGSTPQLIENTEEYKEAVKELDEMFDGALLEAPKEKK